MLQLSNRGKFSNSVYISRICCGCIGFTNTESVKQNVLHNTYKEPRGQFFADPGFTVDIIIIPAVDNSFRIKELLSVNSGTQDVYNTDGVASVLQDRPGYCLVQSHDVFSRHSRTFQMQEEVEVECCSEQPLLTERYTRLQSHEVRTEVTKAVAALVWHTTLLVCHVMSWVSCNKSFCITWTVVWRRFLKLQSHEVRTEVTKAVAALVWHTTLLVCHVMSWVSCNKSFCITWTVVWRRFLKLQSHEVRTEVTKAVAALVWHTTLLVCHVMSWVSCNQPFSVQYCDDITVYLCLFVICTECSCIGNKSFCITWTVVWRRFLKPLLVAAVVVVLLLTTVQSHQSSSSSSGSQLASECSTSHVLVHNEVSRTWNGAVVGL